MADIQGGDELPKFEPLKVKCSESDCESGRHAFNPNRRKKDWEKTYQGECRACGANPVDWDRVKRRDLTDVKGVFSELKHELIREEFFRAPFDAEAQEEARSLGREGLKAAVRPLLAKKIGPEKIFRDGTQTPKSGSAIYFAQHATATCCRKCLQYWHGIEPGRDLTPPELVYCEGLVCAYIDERGPELFGADAPASLGELEPLADDDAAVPLSEPKPDRE